MYFVGSVLWQLCCVGVYGFGQLTAVICVVCICIADVHGKISGLK